MQIYLFIVTLSLFAARSLSSWAPLTRVDNSGVTEIRRATLFIDQKSRLTHYFWCQHNLTTNAFNLLHRTQQPGSSDLSPIQLLDTEHECEELTITGPNDGLHVYIAYGADRRTPHTHCSKDNTDGCLDVYSIDSADAGSTWTRPQQIQRDARDDIWNRAYPRILLHPITGRLWIFYVLSNVEKTSYTIGFVTRPRDSSVYSKEKMLNQQKELIMGLAAGLSRKKTTNTIHVVWTNDEKKDLQVREAYSTSEGVKWKYSKIVGTGYSGRLVSDLAMDQQYMALAYLSGTTAPSRLAVTTNGGDSWQLKELSENTGLEDLALCYKTGKKNAILFTLLNAEVQTEKFEGEFGYIKVSEDRWVRDENPFGDKNLVYDPNVRCFVGADGHFVVRAIGIEDNKLYTTEKSVS